MKNKQTDSLLKFIDASPSPYHAVANAVEILRNAGATELKESADWKCQPGGFYYVVRGDASVIAFKIPAKLNFNSAAFKMIAAHTDSPCLKLKPKQVSSVASYLQWGVEIYGGVLLNSWLDRDLHLSGRVSFVKNGKVQQKLISVTEHKFRVPQLAIHLDREVNNGLKLNAETHMTPVLGIDDQSKAFEELLAGKAGVKKFSEITAMDLVFHDVQPSTYGGLKDEFIYAPRIDNLAMSHAALTAITAAKSPSDISLIALFDHEEVGSESGHGACSNFLQNVLERIVTALGGSRSDFLKSLAESYLISADMAHAVHPNYMDRHDAAHRPVINQGPVIKTNARMRYATDSKSYSHFVLLCDKAKVPHQVFAARNDMPCGSTVGPLVSTRLGVSTIDVGNPQLSMHSIREMAGSEDHPQIIRVFTELFK